MDAKVICVVLSFAILATAGPVVDDTKGHIDNSVHTGESTVEESLMKKLNSKCLNRDISSCMMLKLVTYFNRMMKKQSIEFGDVEITQTSTETITADTSRSLNTENMSEEALLSEVIADKIYGFLRTRSLKWKVLDGADVVISGKSEKDGGLNVGLSIHPSKSSEGDARKKKENGMGAIIAAAVMKIGLLKALAFKALVLLVGKALLVSKLALVLAAIIGLKKLLHHEKHVTYEVVAHPHHEHHEHHTSGGGHDSYGGWGRNFDAQNLAYKAQIPQN
ncbi:hypothetical protein TcasGA2_TC011658 [Tribolium castaneum]|uniref:Osiris 7 n=3 Tax=Tribolium castaneum TaxID=7070 RepID=D6X0U6_TRICA|nr:hypothetical protein TcasGA2_TC011658 [Tribolium castaneum]